MSHRRFTWPVWPVTVLACVLLAIFVATVVETLFLAGQDWRQAGGTSAQALRNGHWETLVTSQFLHGGVFHNWVNVSAIFTLGAPVSLRFGKDIRGALWFYAFFLLCGVISGLAFIALHLNDSTPMIGASGAIFGLWAASARIGGGTSPALLPLVHPFVRSQIGAAVLSNLVIFVLFWLVGDLDGKATVGFTWEAHLGGFVAGWLLIGPLLRLSGRLANMSEA